MVSSQNNVITILSNCFRKVSFVHSNNTEGISLKKNENSSNDFSVNKK